MFSNFDNVDGKYVYSIYRTTADGVREAVSFKDLVKPFQDQMHAVQLANAKYKDLYLELNEEHETLKSVLKKMVQAEKVVEDEKENKENLEKMVQEKVEELLEEPKMLLVKAMEQMQTMIKDTELIHANLERQNATVKDSIVYRIQELIKQQEREETESDTDESTILFGSDDSDDSDDSSESTEVSEESDTDTARPIESHSCAAHNCCGDLEHELPGAEENAKIVLSKLPVPKVVVNEEYESEGESESEDSEDCDCEDDSQKREEDERARKREEKAAALPDTIAEINLKNFLEQQQQMNYNVYRQAYRPMQPQSIRPSTMPIHCAPPPAPAYPWGMNMPSSSSGYSRPVGPTRPAAPRPSPPTTSVPHAPSMNQQQSNHWLPVSSMPVYHPMLHPYYSMYQTYANMPNSGTTTTHSYRPIVSTAQTQPAPYR